MTKIDENNNLTSSGKIEGVSSNDVVKQTDSEINALRALLCEPFPDDSDATEASLLLFRKDSPVNSFYSTSDSESGDETASFFSSQGCFYSCLRFFTSLRICPPSAKTELELSTETSHHLSR